ncbi:MAG TPA: NUDIX hydrolase, partial [Streptomyces sp.]|nr:NUDIX hydrolase [Streptomyces sp.]
PARPAADLPPSAPTDETQGHGVLGAPDELAFPLHTEAVRNWFAGRYR